MTLKRFFADLHIHIGRDHYGNPVKITGSKNLTLTSIMQEASGQKGLDLIGVIDCHAPAVQEELRILMEKDLAIELEDGGIRFEHVTLILGTEIEVYDENCKGPIHVLCYFPYLEQMAIFTDWLKPQMKNVTLSSQRYYGSAVLLQQQVRQLSGVFIPAHIFTPFKSLYGKGVEKSLEEVLDKTLIDAVELGLSSDTYMANGIDEISPYTFLTNSDAHSLQKIAREYQEISMKEASFKEFVLAIHEKDGRKVTRNFGMDPRLGKYYHTVCKRCLSSRILDGHCADCGSTKKINGVKERIEALSTKRVLPPRPPYIHQVPLEYIPSLGKKTYAKLLAAFGTEMNIIHNATFEELKEVVPEKLARAILDNRHGKLKIRPGGGGKYGKIAED